MPHPRNAVPPNDTIDKLMEIWKEVLQTDEIDVRETFLEQGGDSLAAMLAISRIRETFGVNISIENFFIDPATISSFAQLIDKSDRELT